MVATEILNSPVIFLGRGGSGTRLLGQIALDAGVFMGNRINETLDSVEWVPLIYKAVVEKLERAAGYTCGPAQQLREDLRSLARSILDAGQFDGQKPWGWKLPETMLVVPEVLASFENAKVVHLVRHPVSLSLRRSHMTSRWTNPVGTAVLTAAYAVFHEDVSNTESTNEYLDNAVSWAFQVGAVTRYCRTHLDSSRYLELRYEDLFDDWHGVRDKLGKFFNLGQNKFQRPEMNPDRRQQFVLPDPRIEKIWNLCHTAAREHGYDIDAEGAPTH